MGYEFIMRIRPYLGKIKEKLKMLFLGNKQKYLNMIYLWDGV